MSNKQGSNIKDVKIKNKLIILKLLSTNTPMSRVDLAKSTGLTKMTLSNLVTELINENMIREIESSTLNAHSSGRKPILLDISNISPCICGILIRRNICKVIISDLKGNIVKQLSETYPKCLSNDVLKDIIKRMFTKIMKINKRDIIGIGISSIGPVDDINGTILNPPDFRNISNLNIVDFIKEMSDLPIFLINDANSGALAEKMYGLGKNISNYIYLHIMNGIGAGLVLENKLHTGNLGQSGEIGHTSINFSGPLCSCGNNGCLDYYTSVSNLIKRIESLSHIYPNSPLINCKDFSLVKLIDEANNKDSLAMFLLDEFCTYVSYALVNTLTLIDCSSIIIGYDFNIPGTFIENTLLKKLTASASFSKYKKISVRHSNFGANAPLIGSIAIVSYNFFNGSINFY